MTRASVYPERLALPARPDHEAAAAAEAVASAGIWVFIAVLMSTEIRG
jgi:hypothetical protein